MSSKISENKENPSPKTHGRDLTTGSIPRHLIMFSLPMLAGSALQTAYSFVNAIWVGKFLGTTALAAVTVSMPVMFVLVAIGAGLTMATNILVSQHYGARNMSEVRKVVDSSTVLIGVFSVVILIVGEILTPQILKAMDTPADVMPMAVSYMRIFLLSLPFGFGLFLTRSMLQGIGDSTTPLYFQTASLIFTAAMDPVLMFGLLGFPRFGLNGTAWASGIAQVGALVALLIYLQHKKNPVAPSFKQMKVDKKTSLTTIRIGFPSAVQQSLVSIGMVFVTGIVNSFGENTTAAFGAASRIDQLAFMPAMTFSIAISTLAGQNIGANKHERIREIFIWGCILSGGITLLASLVAVTVPHALLKIFMNDATVIRLGEQYLHIVATFYLFFAIMFVSNGIINGAGHTLMTTLISLISLWVVRVPMAWYLAHHMHSVVGVWYAMVASFGVSMVVSLLYFFSGRWKKTVVARRLPATPEAIFADEVGEA